VQAKNDNKNMEKYGKISATKIKKIM